MKKHNTVVQAQKNLPKDMISFHKDYLFLVVILGMIVVLLAAELLRKFYEGINRVVKLFDEMEMWEANLWDRFHWSARNGALKDAQEVIAKANSTAEGAEAIRKELLELKEEVLSVTSEAMPLLREWKERNNEEEPGAVAPDIEVPGEIDLPEFELEN